MVGGDDRNQATCAARYLENLQHLRQLAVSRLDATQVQGVQDRHRTVVRLRFTHIAGRLLLDPAQFGGTGSRRKESVGGGHLVGFMRVHQVEEEKKRPSPLPIAGPVTHHPDQVTVRYAKIVEPSVDATLRRQPWVLGHADGLVSRAAQELGQRRDRSECFVAGHQPVLSRRPSREDAGMRGDRPVGVRVRALVQQSSAGQRVDRRGGIGHGPIRRHRVRARGVQDSENELTVAPAPCGRPLHRPRGRRSQPASLGAASSGCWAGTDGLIARQPPRCWRARTPAGDWRVPCPSVGSNRIGSRQSYRKRLRAGKASAAASSGLFMTAAAKPTLWSAGACSRFGVGRGIGRTASHPVPRPPQSGSKLPHSKAALRAAPVSYTKRKCCERGSASHSASVGAASSLAETIGGRSGQAMPSAGSFQRMPPSPPTPCGDGAFVEHDRCRRRARRCRARSRAAPRSRGGCDR